MHLFDTDRKPEYLLAALPVLLLTGSIFNSHAQTGPPSQRQRDMVRAISRQEMDALLLRKKLPSLTDAPARRLLLKQINDDFKDLQNLNNRMMSETWTRETVDYEFVSNMISQIRSKASCLKSNLNLPQPEDAQSELRRKPTNEAEFRAALLIFDETIMRFVKNPVFQAANTIDVNQATEARRDLETVIELAGSLRKVAVKLRKASQ